MNAKKIMGAVLVALLAAALFVGAGAAADEDLGTVFIYQANTTLPAGVWTLVGGTATVTTVDNATDDGTNVMPGADFVAGTYKLGNKTVDIVKPTASYALSAKTNVTNIPYIVANGGKVYSGSTLIFTIEALADVDVAKWYITEPDGAERVADPTAPGTINKSKGTFKIQAIFDKNDFVEGAPEGIFLDENYFTYVVVGTDDATISASVDTAFSGEAVTFTVDGTPGETYKIEFVGFTKVADNQLQTSSGVVINENNITFTIGNSGKFSFKAVVNASKTANDAKNKATATLNTTASEKNPITIKISAPVVTATTDATSYFIGDNIKISGTSSAETTYTFNITGVNFKSTLLPNADVEDQSEFKKDWFAVVSTKNVKDADGKALDVGTYTIEILKDNTIVKTVTVALKQPFISIIEAPEVVEQGTEAEFLINAEATDEIAAYIFGTNFFMNLSMGADEIEQDEDIKNQFTVILEEADTNKTLMATGQYFMVFQHPMYDGALNVTYNESDKFFYEGTAKLFNVYDRQTANAAQALCDALDSQNFDDMYVKYSFFVVAEGEASYSISEIPTEVTQGTTITISGVDTANDGEEVVVQMLSTAFAAVPKETAGSAAFVLVTTEVAEDGTWEVTLDTSNLNIDEYALTVKIAGDLKKSVTVNVVEAGDEPVNPEQPEDPEQPEQPEEPVAPATPGFGALAALAGLGAVAVLLLRRE